MKNEPSTIQLFLFAAVIVMAACVVGMILSAMFYLVTV
jgi:hypothetical protein